MQNHSHILTTSERNELYESLERHICKYSLATRCLCGIKLPTQQRDFPDCSSISTDMSSLLEHMPQDLFYLLHHSLFVNCCWDPKQKLGISFSEVT